jgi:membrane-associated phospholipid phosphatase
VEEAGPVPLAARSGRLPAALAALAVAFAVLAALVVGGRLSGIDHYALEHWMPGLDPSTATHVVPPAAGLARPFQLGTPSWQKLLDLYVYPASVFVSLAVFTAAAVVLWRRGARTAAVVWAATWFVANALEVAAKVAIAKPALHLAQDGISYHVASFDHSFPSGHTMRAVLVAGVIGFVWARLAWPVAAWALLVPVCLVVASAHVPSDVLGGLVFGLMAVLAAYAALERI